MLYTYCFLFLYILIWSILVYISINFMGGIKRNIAYLFSMSVFFIYQFITPLYGVLQGWYELFGLNISDSLTKLIILYILSIFFVSIFYFISSRKFNIDNGFSTLEVDNLITENVARKWILISLCSIVLWSVISGYGLGTLFLINLFSDTKTSLLEENNQSFLYLKQCFEFSLTGLLFAYSSKMKRREFIFWLIFVLIITLGFGFRYRLIILFCAITIYYILSRKVSYKTPLKILVTMLALIGSLYFIGETRNYYKSMSRGYDVIQEVNISSSEPVLTKVLKYTRNYLSDAALMKYIDEEYDSHDYGHSMFAQTLIRLIPSNLFIGEKPRPYSLAASAESWHSAEGYYAGEAFTHVGEFYYSFGTFGVIILSSLLGWILSCLRIKNKTNFEYLFLSVSISSLFHYYSRGYLPGFFMSYLFLIIPFIFIKFRLKL